MTEYCVDDQNRFHFTKITIFIKKKKICISTTFKHLDKFVHLVCNFYIFHLFILVSVHFVNLFV